LWGRRWDFQGFYSALYRVPTGEDRVTSANQPSQIEVFLSTVTGGKSLVTHDKGETVFAQGDRCDGVFYIRSGECKISVVSEQGKEAVVALHQEGDFFGEGCLTGQSRRLSTATAMSDLKLMRFDTATIRRALSEGNAFSELFIGLLARNARVEADLVDQLFNSSEKRLARLLLLMANFGKEEKPTPVIAKIS
jgi:CRP-like cAMP-binding protein